MGTTFVTLGLLCSAASMSRVVGPYCLRIGYSSVERIERGFSSLAGCYALLASLAASFLIYAHLAFVAHPPHWASPERFVTGSSPGQALHARQAFATIQIAALYFRDRMHTTWLFVGVFAAVWLACLLWMHFGRRGWGLAFNRQEALWIGGISLLVFAAAALYGLGTKGIVPLRIPALVPVSDTFGVAFMLALPVITWTRIHRRHEEEIEAELLRESGDLSARSLARLGLGDDPSNVPIESFSRLDTTPDVKRDTGAMDLFPPHQTFHPDEHAKVAAKPAIECAAVPVAAKPAEPVVMMPLAPIAAIFGEPISAQLPEPVAAARAEPVEVTRPASIAIVGPEPIAVMPAAPVVAIPSEREVMPQAPIAAILAEPNTIQPSEPITVATLEPVAVIPVAPIPVIPAEREPDSIVPEPELSSPAGIPFTHADDNHAANGMNGFQNDLSILCRSWQRIEAMQGEIDDWFEQRRQLAVAHIATPPGRRNSGLVGNLVQDFPDEKVTAIEAEWAEIRSVALDISRSVGDLPTPDLRN